MRSLLGALLVVLSGPFASAADTPGACPPEARVPTPTEIAEGTTGARDRGFLWRITRDDRASYLYGTIHVGRREWLFPGPEVLDAVRSSDVVALELDLLDPEVSRRLRAGMAPKDGQSLPAPLRERLLAQIKAACLGEELLTAMSPVIAATTLTMMSGRNDGLHPAYAVDPAYAAMARVLGKTVVSLESPELQLGLLLGGTREESEAAVEKALDDLERGEAAPLVGRIASMWANGRLGELENYEKWCGCMDTEADRRAMRLLLDDRNPGLAAGIDSMHRSGRRVFGAVGSLHMIGPRGIPALLSDLGYRVERVNFKP